MASANSSRPAPTTANIPDPSMPAKHFEDVKIKDEVPTGGVNPQVEKRLLRKLDSIIPPLLAFSYLLAYMDRNNIGYARLMGLQESLKLSNGQFYNIVTVFFAGYMITVFPANLLIRTIGPKLQFGTGVILFGVFVCCLYRARGYGDLIGLRLLIGFAEAVLSSTPLYLVSWYGRYELGKRIALFYSATTISGVFSGLIAYGVQKNLEGHGGRPSWQWLFLIEGVIAIAFGLLNLTLLPSFPDKTRKSPFLTQQEIETAVKRGTSLNTTSSKLEPRQITASLKDIKTWLLRIVSGVCSTLLAATGTFLPSIVEQFGFSAVDAQLFTVIPYACAFFSMIVLGILSDRLRNKSYFILGSLISCAVGLIILLTTTGKEVRIFATCLLIGGAYPAAVIEIGWVQIIFYGHIKRAIAWGVSTTFAQGLSMAAAQIYTDKPRYIKGHSILLGFVLIAILCTLCLKFIMTRANNQRDLALKSYHDRNAVHPDESLSMNDLCDRHIQFRYPL